MVTVSYLKHFCQQKTDIVAMQLHPVSLASPVCQVKKAQAKMFPMNFLSLSMLKPLTYPLKKLFFKGLRGSALHQYIPGDLKRVYSGACHYVKDMWDRFFDLFFPFIQSFVSVMTFTPVCHTQQSWDHPVKPTDYPNAKKHKLNPLTVYTRRGSFLTKLLFYTICWVKESFFSTLCENRMVLLPLINCRRFNYH